MRIALFLLLLTLPSAAGDFEQSLLDADRAFDKVTLERGLDGWMSVFAEDARMNGRNGEIKGKAALREVYAKMFAQREFSIRWQPLHAESSKDGSLGYTYGQAQVSFRNDKGELQKRDSRYITVWRKEPGGWKVITDLGN